MDEAPEPEYVRITISLPREALEKLDKSARDARRTRSNAIARLIDGLK